MKISNNLKTTAFNTTQSVKNHLFLTNKTLTKLAKESISTDNLDLRPIEILRKRVVVKFFVKSTIVTTAIPTIVILGLIFIPVSFPISVVAGTTAAGVVVLLGGQSFLAYQLVRKTKNYNQMKSELQDQFEQKNDTPSLSTSQSDEAPPPFEEMSNDDGILSVSSSMEFDNEKETQSEDINTNPMDFDVFKLQTPFIDETEDPASTVSDNDNISTLASDIFVSEEQEVIETKDHLSTVASGTSEAFDLSSPDFIDLAQDPEKPLYETPIIILEDPETKPTSASDAPLESILDPDVILMNSTPVTPENNSSLDSQEDDDSISESGRLASDREDHLDEIKEETVSDSNIPTQESQSNSQEIQTGSIPGLNTPITPIKEFGEDQKIVTYIAYKSGASYSSSVIGKKILNNLKINLDSIDKRIPKVLQRSKYMAEDCLDGTHILDQLKYLTENEEVKELFSRILYSKIDPLRKILKKRIYESYIGRKEEDPEDFNARIREIGETCEDALMLIDESIPITEDNFLNILFPLPPSLQTKEAKQIADRKLKAFSMKMEKSVVKLKAQYKEQKQAL